MELGILKYFGTDNSIMSIKYLHNAVNASSSILGEAYSPVLRERENFESTGGWIIG
jgi:hypothetical protein